MTSELRRDQVTPERINQCNYQVLLNRKNGQKFLVSKNGKLQEVKGFCRSIKYFFTCNKVEKVKIAIQAVMQDINDGKITVEDQDLENFYFNKMSRFSRKMFDRNLIGEATEGKLLELIKEDKQHIKEVLLATKLGVGFELIPEGSSGAYLGRNIRNKKLLVFKPSDEGPYGENVPKRLTRMIRKIQKIIRCCCCWNLTRKSLHLDRDYMAEVWAYKVDQFLGLGVVPETDLKTFTSKTFYGKQKEKLGSCQAWQPEMISAEKHYKQKSDARVKIFKEEIQLQKLAILGFITGNQDQALDNWGIAIVGKGKDAQGLVVSFDNGLSFPHTHPRGWMSTRKQYLWAKLPFAAKPFHVDCIAIIEKAFKERDELIKQLSAIKGLKKVKGKDGKIKDEEVAFDANQEARMVDRLSALYNNSQQSPMPINRLFKFKTKDTFFDQKALAEKRLQKA